MSYCRLTLVKSDKRADGSDSASCYVYIDKSEEQVLPLEEVDLKTVKEKRADDTAAFNGVTHLQDTRFQVIFSICTSIYFIISPWTWSKLTQV